MLQKKIFEIAIFHRKSNGIEGYAESVLRLSSVPGNAKRRVSSSKDRMRAASVPM